MKNIFKLVLVSTLLFCTCDLFGIAIEDLNRVQAVIITNATRFNLNQDEVKSKFIVSSVETNDSGFAISAKNTFGEGVTNFAFCYNLKRATTPYLVECRDSLTNGIDYWYHPNGNIRKYIQYKKGNLDGFYIDFHTNAQMKTFINFTNNCIIGLACEFTETAHLVNASTSNVPVPLIFEINPPPQ